MSTITTTRRPEQPVTSARPRTGPTAAEVRPGRPAAWRRVEGRAGGRADEAVPSRARIPRHGASECEGPVSRPVTTDGRVEALVDVVAPVGATAARALPRSDRPDRFGVLPRVDAWEAVGEPDAKAESQVGRRHQPEREYVPVRLTRRGRVLVAVVTVLAATLALAWGAWPASADVPDGPVRSVTVTQGATLWSIAAQTAPGQPTGAVVDDITQLNDLSSAGDLRIGQELSVPTYGG